MTIHILGDGPYAREVAQQLDLDPYGKDCIKFLSQSDDDAILHAPRMLVIGIANPGIKKMVIERYDEKGWPENYMLAISKTVIFSDNVKYDCANIGPLSTIGDCVNIGHFVCICANVTIGHDVSIGKYSTICPGAVVSGNVSIGEGVFIGAGAIIKDNISIGSNVVVGAGAVVIRDVESGCTVVGNPARVIR